MWVCRYAHIDEPKALVSSENMRLMERAEQFLDDTADSGDDDSDGFDDLMVFVADRRVLPGQGKPDATRCNRASIAARGLCR